MSFMRYHDTYRQSNRDMNAMFTAFGQEDVQRFKRDLQTSRVIEYYHSDFDFRKVRKIFDNADVDIISVMSPEFYEKEHTLVATVYQSGKKHEQFGIKVIDRVPHIVRIDELSYILQDINDSLVYITLI